MLKSKTENLIGKLQSYNFNHSHPSVSSTQTEQTTQHCLDESPLLQSCVRVVFIDFMDC